MATRTWTVQERHFLHIFYSVYRGAEGTGNSMADLERLFGHVHGHTFKNGPPPSSRLSDEYAQRTTKGRSKMWRNIIVKPMENYTAEEQRDRARAHNDMKQAAIALGINLKLVNDGAVPPSTTASARLSVPPPPQGKGAAGAPSSGANNTIPPPTANDSFPIDPALLGGPRKRRAPEAAPDQQQLAPNLRIRQQQKPKAVPEAKSSVTPPPTSPRQTAAQSTVEGNNVTLDRLRAAQPNAQVNAQNVVNNPAHQARLIAHLARKHNELQEQINAMKQAQTELEIRIDGQQHLFQAVEQVFRQRIFAEQQAQPMQHGPPAPLQTQYQFGLQDQGALQQQFNFQPQQQPQAFAVPRANQPPAFQNGFPRGQAQGEGNDNGNGDGNEQMPAQPRQ